MINNVVLVSSVVVAQLLSHVQHFATPWTGACQASLSLAKLQVYGKVIQLYTDTHLCFFNLFPFRLLYNTEHSSLCYP